MRTILRGRHKPSHLRAELFQPGDVILSRSRASVSKAIAAASRGRYSHASLVVGSTLQFESDGVGVDYTPIPLAKVEVRPDGDRYLWDISRYRHIAVFRHPSIWQIESAAQSDLASRIQDILQPFMCLEYPSVEALAGATPLLSRFPEVKRGILRLIEQKRSRGEEKVIPGPFCSQLVALCYQQIGLPLFVGHIDPEKVSPGCLANPRVSQLRPVPGLASTPDSAFPNDIEKFAIFRALAETRTRTRKLDIQLRRASVLIPRQWDKWLPK